MKKKKEKKTKPAFIVQGFGVFSNIFVLVVDEIAITMLPFLHHIVDEHINSKKEKKTHPFIHIALTWMPFFKLRIFLFWNRNEN